MNQGWRCSQWLFVLFAAVYWLGGMHVFMHNPGGAGFYLPFNMLGWLFASLMIGVGLWHITLTQQLVLSRAQLWMWLGLVVTLIPFFIHTDVPLDAGLPRFIGIAGGLLLLFSLSQLQLTRAQRFMLLYVLLGAVAIESIFALVQYYLLPPGNWIGYNTLLNRPYGIFQQVNVLASFLAMGIGVALFLCWQDPKLSVRNWRGWLCGGVLFAAVLLQLIIRSRAGMIGAGVELLFFLPVLWLRRRSVCLWVIACLGGVLVAEVMTLWLMGSGRTIEEMLKPQVRTIYWAHSLDMVMRAPWFGWGYGKFESAFVNDYYAIPQTLSGVTRIEQNLDHPHNELIYWLVEGGLVALIGLGLLAWGWMQMLRRQRKLIGVALFLLPFPLLFHAMVEYPFYHSTAHWLALIWLLWFTDAESEQQTVMPLQNWLLLRAMAILIPLITVPFMLTGLHTSWLITQYERGGMKEPALLNKVINPVPWYTRFMYDVISTRLVMALESGNQSELQAYVDWAKGFVNLTPRANVYFNAALALDALGQHDEAIRWRAEGQRLFPADPIFKPKPASAAVSVSGAAMSASSPQAASSAH